MENKSDLHQRKVAVTGCTGMIGSHLVAHLVKSGYRDIVLPMRDRARTQRLLKTFAYMGMEFHQEEFTILETSFTESLGASLEGVDTVFHCAATVISDSMTEQELIDNNVTIARCVADAAIAAGVRKIVHTSSIVVLAPSGNGKCITEESTPHAEQTSSAYARSKFYSDKEMERAAAAGIEVVTLYPAVVLGEGDWSANSSSAMVRLMASGLPLYTDGVMAYVDVRDVARAYVTLDENQEVVGQGFIIAGGNLTYRQLLSYGAAAAHKRRPFIRARKWMIYGAYGIMKALISLRLMRERNVRKENLNSVLYGNRYSGAKIERVCGFEYTPMEETVNRVVSNYIKDKGEK